MRFIVLLSSLALSWASTASAQPAYRSLDPGSGVSLDVLTGIGDEAFVFLTDDQGNALGPAPVDLRSVVTLLSGRAAVGPRWTVVGEIPLAYVDAQSEVPFEVGTGGGVSSDGAPFQESGAQIGNPYLGAELQVRPSVVLGAGVRVPLARYSDSARLFDGFVAGIALDAERYEAYLPDMMALSAHVHLTQGLSPAIRVGLGLRPAYLMDVSDDRLDLSTAALGYQASLGASLGQASLDTGVVGRQILSESVSFAAEPDAAASLAAVVDLGGVRPGLQARIPLLGDRGADAVVGFSLDVRLR